MKKFKFFKIILLVLISLSCFYFFDTPLLLETAFAEDAFNDGSAASNKIQSSNEAETIETSPEKAQEAQPSFFKKVGYFLWDYKWYFIASGVIIFSVIILYDYFFILETTISPEDAVKALKNPQLPPLNTFVEDSSTLTFSKEATKNLPEHFLVKRGVFADAAGCQLRAIFFEDTQSTQLFGVYPAKPLLLEDPNLSILVNQGHILNEVRVTLPNEGILTTMEDNILQPAAATNNPFGYAYDPSIVYWIDHAKMVYPQLNTLEPSSFILQYQKVALVDPFTYCYSYYHQVSVVPTNVEALSTPYETQLQERLLRIYLFKDNEDGWIQ